MCITAFGDVPTAPFTSILESLGINVEETGGLGIVLTDDCLREGLRAYNQEALACKRPYMLIKPVGTTLWLGPIIHPEKTGCWECLYHRLWANRPAEAFLKQQHKNGSFSSRSAARLASTVQTALHMAGARASITSLWSVQDWPTQSLMKRFYEHLWRDDMGKADALWAAKRAMRAEGHLPRVWAGWVLAGDPD